MKKFRNISRILSVLLILAMLLPGVSMPASSADLPCAEAGCSGKYRNGICSADSAHFEALFAENGVYRIGNAGQLYWFAALVNAGANEYDTGDNGDVYNAVLTADITLNTDPEGNDNLVWTPIGLYTGAREYIRYSGTFDGAGHTIYGLYYNNTTYTGRTAGLFGCLDSNGTVRDLTLADSYINGATDIGGIVSHNYGTVTGCTQLGIVSGTGTTGGVVCRNMDGGRVENCENRGTVSGAVTGGIVGENSAGIVNCSNGGTVSGTNSVGGIVGINSGTVADCLNTANVTGSNTHVGGVAGNHVDGGIARCGNTGDVSGASDYIGGVAGVCSGAAVSESWNTGDVTGAGASDAVGGVVGAIDGTNLAESVLASCYNTGKVTGRSWVGGIAGVSGYQKTPQTVEVGSSYNTGTVVGTSHYGAVIGALNKGTVSGSYYLTGCTSAGNVVSGAAEATAKQFASGEITYLLNGSTGTPAAGSTLVWYQNLDLENTEPDASPVLDPAHGVVNFGYRTCTQTGYTNREDYDVPGHSYVNGTCTHCGQTDPDAPAETEVASGWSGELTWILYDSGRLVFSGTGNMKNYGYAGGQPWLNKGVDITAVVIPEGVKTIGSGAFRNLTTLKSVTFPETTLTRMGEAAFYGTGLTAVEIPASLWTIQPYTFKNCTSLASVTFHEGNLQKISDGAFYGTGLTELVLPDCLDILDVYAFKGCANLTSITIGSGLTELREAVFYGTAIPSITVPDGITRIGPYVFKNCVNLETIDLPESLLSVGEASFYACTGLTAVELPDAVTAIGNYAFRKCAAIEELTLGAELVTIGECSFYGCTGLTDLVIPDKVTTIKPYAFKTCTGLTSVTLGSSVKTIGEGAFNTCTGLKNLIFPASLTTIGDYCFSGSWNLWKLTFQGDAPAIGTGAFKGMAATAYYPGDNATWTADTMQNYGGKITWTAM